VSRSRWWLAQDLVVGLAPSRRLKTAPVKAGVEVQMLKELAGCAGATSRKRVTGGGRVGGTDREELSKGFISVSLKVVRGEWVS